MSSAPLQEEVEFLIYTQTERILFLETPSLSRRDPRQMSSAPLQEGVEFLIYTQTERILFWKYHPFLDGILGRCLLPPSKKGLNSSYTPKPNEYFFGNTIPF